MLTVSKLAHRCGLSRSTVLYYESIGLLKPAFRSESNYRKYDESDLLRLRQICAYRDAGLKLEDIRSILDGANSDASSVLKRRLIELDEEIGALREHQQSILRLLKADESVWRNEVINKEKWVSVMKAAGFTEDQMKRWHAQFEKNAPQEHQEFLEFLHIPKEEIHSIREWSRKG